MRAPASPLEVLLPPPLEEPDDDEPDDELDEPLLALVVSRGADVLDDEPLE